MGVRYYVRVPPGGTEPTGLYRFFDDDRLPEYYKIGLGWVPYGGLYERIASGEVSARDEVSSEAAARVASKWGGSL